MRDVHGQSPEQIRQLDYPHLTMAQIYAALAYFEDHREQMAEYERQEAEFVEQFKSHHPGEVRDLRLAE